MSYLERRRGQLEGSIDEKERTIDALQDALRFKRQRDKAISLMVKVISAYSRADNDAMMEGIEEMMSFAMKYTGMTEDDA